MAIPTPIEIYKQELKDTPLSTIRSRNESWFERIYVEKKEDPIELHKKHMLEIGKIYTFAYDPIYKDELSFYDIMPINMILGYVFTSQGRINPYGIQMSFIPPKTRILILSKIFKIFRTSHIQPNIKRIEEGWSNLKFIPMQYDIAKKILADSGFEFAIRSYRMDHVRSKPRIISYNDWWRLSTLSSHFIKKMTLRQIYYLYNQNAIDGYKIGEKTDVVIKKTKIKDIKEYIKTRNT